MDTFSQILNGFDVVMQPMNLFYVFIGCFVGTVIGVLPGLGPAAAVALLLPLTFGLDHTGALIMIAGIYYGAMYGGSTTSILMNIPGEAASVITCFDGYEMAKKGRAGAALAISAIGSFIAGTIGIILLSLIALPLADFAIQFGPAEYFTLMLFALMTMSSLTGKSLAKGIISLLLGLMIATVGIDLQTGRLRYTMGLISLHEGVPFLAVVVGIFALGEVFENIENFVKGGIERVRIKGKIWLTREEWRRSVKPIFRGGLIGFIVGVLPGAGGIIASMLSYGLEKKISNRPEEFGKGAIEGVAGPESANNGSSSGAMVPLLTLGVPGSGTTAVILGAFIMYGIQPGPGLFRNHPDIVWGLIDSMYLGNLILLFLNLPLIGIFVRILYIPNGILLPLILGISSIGVYTLRGSMADLYIALLFGVLGYIFRKVSIPTAPLVLALVIGKPMEQSFRQAMTISGSNPTIFVRSYISVTLLILALLSIVVPMILERRKKFIPTGSNLGL